MRRILLSVFIGLLGLGFTAVDVQAKRLGGGASQGMKRQMPPRAAPESPPPQQAPTKPNAANAAAPTTTAAPAPAPRRSWLGPIAGIAAGLGIAALLSHFGMGEGVANVLTMLLLAAAAVFVVRWALRRFGPATAARPAGLRYAGAGAPGDAWSGSAPDGAATPDGRAAIAAGSGLSPAAVPAAAAPALPPGFDRAEFERIAKTIFVRLQAANDAGDVEDLRRFSTPEMFAAFRVDLQDRKAPQRTDVVRLDAELLDIGTEGDRQVVSVRFHGLIREEIEGVATPFDEVWHLVRGTAGDDAWRIAGIEQQQAVH